MYLFAAMKISKMQNVELRPRISPEIAAELDRTLQWLASGRTELGREWLRLAPHYVQRNAIEIANPYFSIHQNELHVRPFGPISVEERIPAPENGFRKRELLLVRSEGGWKAVIVFAKYEGPRRKKQKGKKKKRSRGPSVLVSGGLPSLGKRR